MNPRTLPHAHEEIEDTVLDGIELSLARLRDRRQRVTYATQYIDW